MIRSFSQGFISAYSFAVYNQPLIQLTYCPVIYACYVSLHF